MAWGALRGLVGEGKYRRFQDGSYDLDLAYITDRLIGMSAPASGFVEAAFRNDFSTLRLFLEERHGGHYRVYNLCSERGEDVELWSNATAGVEWYPVDDHNPGPLEQLQAFCDSVERHLKEDARNVAVVHCKAGKGRTGMFLSSYLVHARICATAQLAMETFAARRMRAGLPGVTVPSQIRHIRYYEKMRQNRWAAAPIQTLQLDCVRILAAPDFGNRLEGSGCQPYFKVKVWKPKAGAGRGGPHSLSVVYNHRKRTSDLARVDGDTPCTDLRCAEGRGPLLRGHVQVALYTERPGWSNEEMCHIWFHTGFEAPGIMKLTKADIDMAHKDKRCHRFPEGFQVHLFLSAPTVRT